MVINLKNKCGPHDYKNFIVMPGRDLCGFNFEIAEDRPGILAEISSILREHDISILYIYGTYMEEDSSRIVTMVDMTGKDVDLEELTSAFKGIKGIGHIEVIEPVTKGFIFDKTSFPLTVMGERVVFLRKSAFKELISGLVESMGHQATSGLLYQIGVRMGRGLAKKHKEIAKDLGIEDPIEVLKKISGSLFQSLGFGKAEVIDREGDSIRVRKYNCIECEAIAEIIEEGHGTIKKGSLRCGLIRGIMDGVVSEVMGKGYASTEEKCTAIGDEYCELVFRPSKGGR